MVASRLQDSGYRTYIAGKWNVGSEPYNLPNRRGFDKSIVQGDTGSDNWEPAKQYLPHLPEVYWFEDGKNATMPSDFYSSEYFIDRTIGYIDGDPRKHQPFFAYVGFQANHVPVQAPQAYIDKYKGKYHEGWTVLRERRLAKAIELGLVPPGTRMTTMSTTADWKALSDKDRLHMERQMEVYAAMAEAMDAHVGRLVDHLKKTGQFDNTVFVFLSDNGPDPADPLNIPVSKYWVRSNYRTDGPDLGAKTGSGHCSAGPQGLCQPRGLDAHTRSGVAGQCRGGGCGAAGGGLRVVFRPQFRDPGRDTGDQNPRWGCRWHVHGAGGDSGTVSGAAGCGDFVDHEHGGGHVGRTDQP